MLRSLVGLAVFGVMVVILIGLLQLANWVPSAIDEGAFRRYRTIDDVRSHLKIHPVYEPVYYPRSVLWPPRLVAAQTHPYAAVAMEFQRRDSEETALTITQTALTRPPLAEKVRLSVVRARITFALKGRPAVLESGVCRGSEECSRLSWDDGAFRISLVMTEAPLELVRMAESMVSETGKGRDPADPPGR